MSTNGRWCAGHGQEHGTLHVCPLYPDEVRAEVQAASDRFRANLADPKWQAEQREAGIPQVVIDLYKIFGGVK